MSIFALRSNSLASSAYKNLSGAQTRLNDNISRLTSGLRITKTADDSVGSSIAVRMANQIDGMKQANANAQQANKLLQTAEGGLSDISDILGRMRVLAVQAASDNVNDDDRASIDLEFQALGDESTRIARATEYDDKNLLDGTYTGKSLQIGADNDADHQLSISIGDAGGAGLGLMKTATLKGAHTSGQTIIKIDGSSGFEYASYKNWQDRKIRIDGDEYLFDQIYPYEGDDFISIHGVTDNLWDGTSFSIPNTFHTALTRGFADGTTVDSNQYVDVTSVDNARDAITALDHAIDVVNTERSKVGAMQNRLSFTISNLSNHTQAIEAGRSSIEDVDFAAEATDLVKTHILAQSATSMLAQASAISQDILSLIR